MNNRLCNNWWKQIVNIKESCYLGNLATVNCNADREIEVAFKHNRTSQISSKGSLPSMSQGSLMISVKKTVDKNPG